jgi:hypothetical protein
MPHFGPTGLRVTLSRLQRRCHAEERYQAVRREEMREARVDEMFASICHDPPFHPAHGHGRRDAADEVDGAWIARDRSYRGGDGRPRRRAATISPENCGPHDEPPMGLRPTAISPGWAG